MKLPSRNTFIHFPPLSSPRGRPQLPNYMLYEYDTHTNKLTLTMLLESLCLVITNNPSVLEKLLATLVQINKLLTIYLL